MPPNLQGIKKRISLDDYSVSHDRKKWRGGHIVEKTRQINAKFPSFSSG